MIRLLVKSCGGLLRGGQKVVSGLKNKSSIVVLRGFKNAALCGIEFAKDEGRDRFTQRFVRLVWA